MRAPCIRAATALLVVAAAWSFVVSPAEATRTDLETAPDSDSGSDSPGGARYVALGDSISSGEGGLEYDRFPEPCHRSAHAFPRVLASEHPRLGEPDLRACSRSSTSKFSSGADLAPAPSQRDGLSAATELVTITLGINDLNPELVLLSCLLVSRCDLLLDSGPSAVTRRIEDLRPVLAQVYRDIRQDAPNASVFVVGYPQLFCAGEEFRVLDRLSVRLLAEQLDLVPSLGLPLSLLDEVLTLLNETVPLPVLDLGVINVSEVDWLRARFDQLNAVIKAAAAEAGVRHVDASDAFEGHQLCDQGRSWVHGLDVDVNPAHLPTLDNLLHPFHNSFHPTAPGYEKLAEVVGKAGAPTLPKNPEPKRAPPPARSRPLDHPVPLLTSLLGGLLGRS